MWAAIESDYDAQEYARLLRFVSRQGRSFGLAVATYEDPSVANDLRQRASAELPDLEFGTVSLADAGGDLFALIESESVENDAVFVVGLDSIITDKDARRVETRALINLNLARDELPERIAARVVLWISREAYAQLAAFAWDLLEVALTRFDFRDERAPEGPHESLGVGWPTWMSAPDGVDTEELRRQAASLAHVAAQSELVLTGADAASSAGRIYAEIGQFDRSVEMLELAAERYELAANTGAGVALLLAAVTQRRRSAWAALASEDEQGALARAKDALSLATHALDQADSTSERAAERERQACVISLAALEVRVDGVSEVFSAGSDETLLARWREGERSAGDELLRRYYPRILRYVSGEVPERDNHDLLQDIFVRLFQPSRATEIVSVSGYIFRIARAMIVEYHRRHRGESRPENEADFDEFTDGRIHHTETVVIEDELVRWLLVALSDLDLREAAVLELLYFQELTVSEVAAILDIQPASVRALLSSARDRLRERYRAHSGDGHEGPSEGVEALLRTLGEQLRG